MGDKEILEEKYEAKLEEWRADLDKLKAKAEQASADSKIALQERIDDLEKKRDEAAVKLAELRDNSGDAASEVWQGFERSFEELGRGFKAAYEKFKGDRA